MALLDSKDLLRSVYDALFERDGNCTTDIEHVIDWLKLCESEYAVDAAPVVRCKDCVYGYVTQAMSGRDRIDCMNGKSASGTVKWLLPLDWYCPDGEMNDDND